MKRPVRRDGAPIQAVGRTLDALEFLAGASDGVTVLQLAEQLGVEKSIASRLLASLLDREYVVRDPVTDSYRLSLRLLGVAARYADRTGFPAICQPSLEALSQRTGELVQLSVVDGDHLFLSAYAQARQQLAILPALGHNKSLHATASGKAWLASLPEDEAIGIALGHGLKPRTERTITQVGTLIAELDRVRADGYALARAEFTDEVNSVAAPIGGARLGVVVATVAVSAPAGRLGEERVAELAPLVAATGTELEAIWPIGALRTDSMSRQKIATEG
jgi:IclR family acetate operon transcriptional repressor